MLAGMGQCVAHEVHTAALPGTAQRLGDSCLDAAVVVRDGQSDAAKPTAGQPAQEARPEHLGFGGANVHAQHLTLAIGVDADGNDRRHTDDAPSLMVLHIRRIDPR